MDEVRREGAYEPAERSDVGRRMEQADRQDRQAGRSGIADLIVRPEIGLDVHSGVAEHDQLVVHDSIFTVGKAAPVAIVNEDDFHVAIGSVPVPASGPYASVIDIACNIASRLQ